MSSTTPPTRYEDNTDAEPTEQTNLLSDTPIPGINSSRVVLLIALTVVALGCGEVLIVSPQTRLIESILCRKYYDTHDSSIVGRDGWLPEKLCKIEPVESGVALLKGWQEFFDCIPSTCLEKSNSTCED